MSDISSEVFALMDAAKALRLSVIRDRGNYPLPDSPGYAEMKAIDAALERLADKMEQCTSSEGMYAIYNASMVMGDYDEADAWAERLRARGFDIPERDKSEPVGLFNSHQE